MLCLAFFAAGHLSISAVQGSFAPLAEAAHHDIAPNNDTDDHPSCPSSLHEMAQSRSGGDLSDSLQHVALHPVGEISAVVALAAYNLGTVIEDRIATDLPLDRKTVLLL